MSVLTTTPTCLSACCGTAELRRERSERKHFARARMDLLNEVTAEENRLQTVLDASLHDTDAVLLDSPVRGGSGGGSGGGGGGAAVNGARSRRYQRHQRGGGGGGGR